MQYTSIQCPDGEECNNGVCAEIEPIVVEEELECTDSDNGIDLETQGTTEGLYGVAGEISLQDYCISGQVNNGHIIEYFCSPGNRVQYHRYECPPNLECNNGACLTPQITDTDNDGIPDDQDVCPEDPLNDVDQDGLCAGDDNCPTDYNPGQENADTDNYGDVCDVCPYDMWNDIASNRYFPVIVDRDCTGMGHAVSLSFFRLKDLRLS